MHIDVAADINFNPSQIEETVRLAESAGYDGLNLVETKHDAFLALALAARASETITLQSAVAVAFARNPMTVAALANDLHLVSRGRFQLGLGSQVRAHIEQRFSMPWSQPTARMEEFVTAIRAIWDRWNTGTPLKFRGTFYQHTLMTDFFDPGPNPFGTPPILLAAVGARMTEVVGRVADGYISHPFNTADYLREVTVPTLTQARGSLDGFSMSVPVFAILGETPEERAKAAAASRRQLAFFASTPSYRPTLEHHGWGTLQDKLGAMAAEHAWTAMSDLIDDDILDAFTVYGDAAQVAEAIHDRFGGLATRISLFTPYQVAPEQALAVARYLRLEEDLVQTTDHGAASLGSKTLVLR
jgi:probable F420-dependent oxidoreductase